MKDAVIRARIDADLKAKASAVLASHGLELSDALRLFLRQVVACQGVSFLYPSAPCLSGDELSALKKASQQRDHRLAAEQDVSGGEMLLVRPQEARSAQIHWPDPKHL